MQVRNDTTVCLLCGLITNAVSQVAMAQAVENGKAAQKVAGSSLGHSLHFLTKIKELFRVVGGTKRKTLKHVIQHFLQRKQGK